MLGHGPDAIDDCLLRRIGANAGRPPSSGGASMPVSSVSRNGPARGVMQRARGEGRAGPVSRGPGATYDPGAQR